jgi:hypothetical protein
LSLVSGGKFNLTVRDARDRSTPSLSSAHSDVYEAGICQQYQPGDRRDKIHAATNAIGGRNIHAPNQFLKLTLNPMRW